MRPFPWTVRYLNVIVKQNNQFELHSNLYSTRVLPLYDTYIYLFAHPVQDWIFFVELRLLVYSRLPDYKGRTVTGLKVQKNELFVKYT